MKIQNKKTGEIGQIGYVATQDGQIIVEDISGEEYPYSVICSYKTLAELNEEWEDYKPAEPLIKDKKIRKAVRAWAESLGLQEVYCASNGYEIYGGIDDWVIQFEGEPFPFADKNKIYSIAELCGEEEE